MKKGMQIKKVLLIGTSVGKSLLSVLSIYLLQKVVDSVRLESFPLIFLAFMGVLLAGILLQVSNMWILGDISDNQSNSTEKRLLQKVDKIKYELFEAEETQSQVDYCISNTSSQMRNKYAFMNSLVGISVQISGTMLYLFSIRWWLVPGCLILYLPVWWMLGSASEKEMQATSNYWGNFRLQKLYSKVFTSKEYAKEMRIFAPQQLIHGYWNRNLTKFHHAQVSSNLGVRIRIGLYSMGQFWVSSLVLVILLLRHENLGISIGVVVAVAEGIWAMGDMFQGEIYQLIRQYKGISKWKESLEEVITLPCITEKNLQLDSIHEIVFKNVSYCYPGSDKEVLTDISLSVKEGVKYALVGENGSGKSTLIKLMIGLLEPTRGHIYINGIEANNYDPVSRMKAFGCAFQNCAKYNMTLKDNISFEENDDEVRKKLSALFPEILKSCPSDIYTELGYLGDTSVDLSGGEWQKINMARACISSNSMLVLDEPTAALDPLGEVELYEKMHDILRDRTTIVVTHRLGIVGFVDEVIVLNNGKVHSKGKSEELLKEDAYYAQIYQTSRNWLDQQR